MCNVICEERNFSSGGQVSSVICALYDLIYLLVNLVLTSYISGKEVE